MSIVNMKYLLYIVNSFVLDVVE